MAEHPEPRSNGMFHTLNVWMVRSEAMPLGPVFADEPSALQFAAHLEHKQGYPVTVFKVPVWSLYP